MEKVKCFMLERPGGYRFKHRSIPDRERLFLVKRGSVTVHSGKFSVTANQGEYITIAAGLDTEAEYTGEDNCIIVFSFGGMLAKDDEYIRAYPHNADAALLMESALDDSRKTPYRLPAILCAVLHHLSLNDNTQRAGDVRPVVRYLNEHYKENRPVSDYAAMAYVSESHFRKLFLAATGMSPIEYRNSARIRAARELISEGCSVAEAAEAVGFNSTSFYCRLSAKEKQKELRANFP